MFIDARTLPSGAELEADVCIVGAGPAGIAIGLQLLGTGLQVILVESGGITPEIPRKHLDRGSSIGYQYYDLMFTRARAFGGTSTRWHMHVAGDEGWMVAPLDPIDFEARQEIPDSGWPFGASELAPYYERAHAISNLGRPTFEVGDYEGPGMARLPLPEDRVVTAILQRGMSSFAHHRDTFATAANIRVLHHATVVDIESTGEPAMVTGLRVAVSADRKFRVTARQFVLAGGGIENTRLLLTSRSHQPAGLGNGHDLVGRHFMEHPAGRIGFVRPDDPSVVRRAALYDSHPEGNVFIQAALKLNPDVVRAEGLRNAAFFLLPRDEAFISEGIRSVRALVVGTYRRPWVGQTVGHLRNMAGGLVPIGRTLLGRFRPSATPSILVVRTQAEQAPNPASRITLGTDRDRYGTPRPVLDWRLTSDDIESIRRSEDLVAAELERAGFGRVERRLGEEDPPVVFEGNHHHMGTTRMHADPGRGVVDADGRVHGIRNLFVTGTSTFPTGGYINPTYTVVALGIRLGDHLRKITGAT
jgi:choline dehydrogenase-like flavoprotein